MQLFTWRIGQAQSLKGARIISTNTDGLYSVMEKTMNDAILAEEAENIHVEIEPEPMYLISKDTNNRIELSGPGPDAKIFSASGGTLGCHKGPTPTKALAHPAIIDWALREYLVRTASTRGLGAPFDPAIGTEILQEALSDKGFGRTAKALVMFQNVLASSSGSITYIFGTDSAIPPEGACGKDGRALPRPKPIILQTYNRVFLIRDDAPVPAEGKAMHVYAAAARAIPAPTMAKRLKDRAADPDIRTVYVDPTAADVLKANGVTPRFSNKDVIVKKVTGLDPEWTSLILNRDLFTMSQDHVDELIDALDMDRYLGLLDDAYAHSWQNAVPVA